MMAARLAAIVIAIFIGALALWWGGLNDYRITAQAVSQLQRDMEAMKAHVEETERVLIAVDSLRVAVQTMRSISNEALEASRNYSGNERLEHIERLLKDDLIRRGDSAAAIGAVGGLPGAEGIGQCVAAP